MDNQMIATIASIVGAGLLFLLRLVVKSNADAKAKVLETGLDVAASLLENVAKNTTTTVDDKVAVGLRFLADWFRAHDLELSSADAEKAKLVFQAMHGVAPGGK